MTRFLSGNKRYDARGGVKRPGLSSVVIIMLAIGIGGVTTIFTALYTLQMKSLSVSRPEAARDDEPFQDIRSSVRKALRPGKTKPAVESHIAATPTKPPRKQKPLTTTSQARRG